MRWNTLANHDPHPVHWIWLWAPAALLLVVIGIALAVEWIEKQKRRVIGPSDCWRPWLAWYPVRIENGKTAWLEWIERKAFSSEWIEHRSLSSDHRQK